ncbi:MAG: sigma-54 dependent transcriptional regulator [Acidobacteriota bacterium]
MSETRLRRLLVVDDEAAARRGMMRALGRNRFTYVEAESGIEALDRLAALAIDLVLLDLRMPGLDGRGTLEQILELPTSPPVIIVTADAELRTAIDLVRVGAADFVAKPYEIEELRWIVDRALDGADLRQRVARLDAEVRQLAGGGELIGESPPMRRLFEALAKVGPTQASVLIRGDTGTGKELVAKRLHALSPVANGPFVALNCAAVPETLLESELFGHRKGAFTGADRDRAGRFRDAHGGTLFLDEIGDMPSAAQAKLLRVLQERVVEPLGGGPAIDVEVRVIAATHQDLGKLCADGRFREDLYYRLRVVELDVPPLRLRGDDTLLLARAFLGHALGGKDIVIEPTTEAALRAYGWPGNVRELKNAMERAAIFAEGTITIDDLPSEIRDAADRPSPTLHPSSTRLSSPSSSSPSSSSPSSSSPSSSSTPTTGIAYRDAKAAAIDHFERTFFGELLARHQGNISRAAREADMHRQSLQKKLRQLDMSPNAI